MFGYTTIFTKENNMFYFLFAALSRKGQPSRKEFAPGEDLFFLCLPLRREAVNINDRIVCFESIHIHLKKVELAMPHLDLRGCTN